jgi:hypothetical protein
MGSPATECPSNLITYQEEPQAGANTGDGPCDEEEKDGPEDCEERIAGGHGYCFVGRFVLVIRIPIDENGKVMGLGGTGGSLPRRFGMVVAKFFASIF